ncbi:MAG: magnesium transporter CorA family protein [Burkholderiaceae bacterium]|nr:magnesium transporter CorA family protein [Burkholderiaceae bacterium]MDP1968579.1 magnesium transporter CorA family protein [Burkholderiaceae bacterium]
MRVFSISGGSIAETDALPIRVPEGGYVWIACARAEFEMLQHEVQATLQALCGVQLVEPHTADLLSNQLPSHYDYTSQYDIMVFRRLAAMASGAAPAAGIVPPVGVAGTSSSRLALGKGGPPVLRRIDTSPVGFAVFDTVLLSVHPTDCAVRDSYATRLLNASAADQRLAGARLPASPADMMVRMINQIVDAYLDLRRELTHQLDHWQAELLDPRSRFNNWTALMQARQSLHLLDEVCDDQRSAIQDWIDALESWPDVSTPAGQRERDLLKVRSRDVLEHIERVVHHVRRLEQSAETAVQMHFSAQSHRTNDIMRTLTALTAIFLPLNLITGFFGMNFEFMPLIHWQRGFWVTVALMVSIAVVTGLVFWRKRYLARSGR